MTAAFDSVILAGGAMLPFGRKRDGSTPRDWARQVARAAIADSGLDPGSIDALVIASESDFFSLQLAPAALLADEIGLVPRAAMRVEMGGASGAQALRAGFMHVRSGLARAVLVLGYEWAASHLPSEEVRLLYGLSFDADIEGFAGAAATVLYALTMQAHMARFGTDERQLAAVSVKNHGNALANPDAHKPMRIAIDDVLASPWVSPPYRLLDCSLVSDGAAAVVLASAELVQRGPWPRVRIAGCGCASDRVRIGDREQLHRFEAKAASARAAYAMAGVRDPSTGIDVAEVYDAYTGAEIQAIEALGLAPEGRAAPELAAGGFAREGRLPVNLSGGLIGQGGPPGATGIAQALAVTRLLQGSYHAGLQPERELRTGVIDAHGGVGTVAVTHVLERLD